MNSKIVTKIDIPGFQWQSGKIRERAIVDEMKGLMIFVTTDRISAFDSVLPTPIPQKGLVLNQISIFWKKFFEGEVIPVECVVRGYISGSFWEEYQKIRGGKKVPYKVSVFGHELPGNLQESEELLMPIFTPATKSLRGHDLNLSYEEMVNHLTLWLTEHPEIKRFTNAELLAQNLRSTSLALYLVAREYARKRGIIIADTKFEFGIRDGKLILIDEVLTPDSSRFWLVSSYQTGQPQESLDKQPVRDWLVKEAKWNKEPPAPELPPEVVEATVKRYQEVYFRLTGGTIQ